MSLSVFRQNKLTYVFNRFFDTNNNGTIEKDDFNLAVDQLCKIRGWTTSDPRHESTKASFFKMWEILRKRAYKEDDEKISPEEFCQLWRNPDAIEDWEKVYMDLMFQLQDTSGDALIDEDEFANVCDAYGINTAESRQAFQTFTNQGHTKVDKAYFAKLWQQYFYSDNPSDLGNFMFGKINFNE